MKNERSKSMRTLIVAVICSLGLAGCSDMNSTQQRALSGTAIGAGGGAILGAIGGNAGLGAVAGAGAGLVGGLIYDKVKKDEAASYQQGYSAGKQSSASQ
jgi:hypothetical protein